MSKSVKKRSLIICAAIAIAMVVVGLATMLVPAKNGVVSAATDTYSAYEVYKLDFADSENRGDNKASNSIADATIVSNGNVSYTEDAINGKTAINLVQTGVRQNYVHIPGAVLNNESITLAGWFKNDPNMGQWTRPISANKVTGVSDPDRMEIMPYAQDYALNVSLKVNGGSFQNKGNASLTTNVYTQYKHKWGTEVKYPTYDILQSYGGWVHYAYEFTTEKFSYYVNGNLEFSVNRSDLMSGPTNSLSLQQIYSESGNLLLGATYADGTKDWSGSIADFRIYSKALSGSELKAAFGIDDVDYNDFLLASYDFENGVKDSVSGYNGTLVNNAKVEYDNTRESNVLVLDGAGTSKTASMMTIPARAAHGLNQFTISTDIYIDKSVGKWARIWEIAPNGVQQLVLAVNWSGNGQMNLKFTTQEETASETWEIKYSFAQYDCWKNITTTFDGSIACVYIDGVLIATSDYGYKNSIFYNWANTKFTFGGTYYCSDQGTPCKMDNIKIYTTALTEKEISDSYEATKIIPNPVWYGTDLNDVILEENSHLFDVTESNLEYMMSMDPDRILYHHRKVAGLDTKGATWFGGWEDIYRGLAGQFASNYLAAMVRAACHMPNYKAQKTYDFIDDSRNNDTCLERTVLLVKEFRKCQEAYAVYDPDNAGYFGGLHMNQYDNFVGRNPENKMYSYGSYHVTTYPDGTKITVNMWVPWRVKHDNLKAAYDVYMNAPTAEVEAIGKQMMFDDADWVYNTIYSYTNPQRQRLVQLEYGGMAEALWNIAAVAQEMGGEYAEKAANYAWAARYFEESGLITDWLNNKDNLSSGTYNNLKGKHANTTIPKMFALVAAYEATGDAYYLTAAKNAFAMVAKRLYAFGGTSMYENWQHDPYEMVTDKETAETCCTLNMLKLADYLFRWTGDKVYADFYEHAYLNHILASMDPANGLKTYFVTTEFGAHKTFHDPYNTFWCCTSTGLESFAKLNYGSYYVNDDEVTVNMFHPTTFKYTDDITLVQTGDFYNSQSTKITVQGQGKFTLRIRVPDWAETTVLKVNGVAFTGEAVNGYYEIEREWNDGDEIDYSVPFTLRLVDLNKYGVYKAFMYGPLTMVADLGTNNLNLIQTSQRTHASVYTGPVTENILYKGELLDNVKFDLSGAYPKFTVSTHNQGDITFMPFNRVFQRRFGMYFTFAETPEITGDTLENNFDYPTDYNGDNEALKVENGALVNTEATEYLFGKGSSNYGLYAEIQMPAKEVEFFGGFIVLASENGGYYIAVERVLNENKFTVSIYKITSGNIGTALTTATITNTLNKPVQLEVKVNNGIVLATAVNGSNISALSIKADDAIVNSADSYGIGIKKGTAGFEKLSITNEDVSYKDLLASAISYGDTITADGYTTTSYSLFTNKLASVKEILASSASEVEIKAANSELRSAIKNLIKVGNPTAFNNKLAEVEALDESIYTATSWEKLATVIAEAKAIDVTDVSQNTLDGFVVRLNVAQRNLVVKADFTALNQAIQTAESLTETDYTTTSWKKVSNALNAAKALTEEASQETVDKAKEDLLKAIEGLVDAPTEPENPGEEPTPEEPTPDTPSGGGNSGGLNCQLGVSSSVWMFALIAMLGAIVIFIKRRKNA